MNRPTLAALVAVLVSATTIAQVPPVPDTPAKGSVTRAAWLTGCWSASSARDGATINETWLAPRGGTMMGTGITYVDERTVTWEAMRMYNEGDSVKLWLRPAGRTDVIMTLDAIGDNFFEFSAKEGEVTTRLRYERKSETEITATLRFVQGESRRGADFGFTRTECPPFFLPVVKEVAKEAPKEAEKK